MSEEIYHQQVELMLKVLPIVAKSKRFALKGGTAINFSCVICLDYLWILI